MKNYVGKLVFLERQDGKYAYDGGEYLILKQSPFTLYGVKPVGGYESHKLKAFTIKPGEKEGWSVVDSADADLETLADDVQYFADTLKRDEKPAYIASVYQEAARIADMIRRLIPIKSDVVPVTVTSMRIALSDGTTLCFDS